MKGNLIFCKLLRRAGENRPWIVMIHGFTADHRIFNEQEKAFGENFNMMLVDLRGHGSSAHIEGPYGREEYADDIEAAVKEYGLKDFLIWGTHTGASIGLIYALRHPDQVLGLILEGTPLPGFKMPRLAALVERAERIAKERGIDEAKNDWFDHADWFEYMRKHPWECRAKEHREIINEFEGNPFICPVKPREAVNVSIRLKELDLPVLAYNGKEDMPEFLEAHNYMKPRIPGAEFALIPNSGGFPCWENPCEVNKVAGSFLNKIVLRR